MSARKIALLVLIVGFAATVETAWNVRGDVNIGPEGCRVMGGRFYGPSWSFEAAAERALAAGEAPRLEVENAFGEVKLTAGAPGVVKVRLRKVVFQPTEEKARAFAERIELRLTGDGDAGAGLHEPRRDRPPRPDRLRDPPRDRGPARDRGRGAQRARARRALGRGGRRRRRVLRRRLDREAWRETSSSRPATATWPCEGIGGALELNSRHGSVSVSGVRGASKLDVQHGDVEVRRSAGLEVDLAHGELKAEGVGGDLVVRGEHAAGARAPTSPDGPRSRRASATCGSSAWAATSWPGSSTAGSRRATV